MCFSVSLLCYLTSLYVLYLFFSTLSKLQFTSFLFVPGVEFHPSTEVLIKTFFFFFISRISNRLLFSNLPLDPLSDWFWFQKFGGGYFSFVSLWRFLTHLYYSPFQFAMFSFCQEYLFLMIEYLSVFFFFLTRSLLEYNCFTILYSFLLYNKVNQAYAYTCPHIPSLLSLPPTLPMPPL